MLLTSQYYTFTCFILLLLFSQHHLWTVNSFSTRQALPLTTPRWHNFKISPTVATHDEFSNMSRQFNDKKKFKLPLQMISGVPYEAVSTLVSQFPEFVSTMGRAEAEALAGPFFGASLFPYLAFLYFLNVPENETPKGVTVGFSCCLLFVFLTIPAAIAAEVLFGVSLADSDWLHGSAESLLTVTNLVTVVAFRQALQYRESIQNGENDTNFPPPQSVVYYDPMVKLVGALTGLAALTALVPALTTPEVHTPYLNGFMDLIFPINFIQPGCSFVL